MAKTRPLSSLTKEEFVALQKRILEYQAAQDMLSPVQKAVGGGLDGFLADEMVKLGVDRREFRYSKKSPSVMFQEAAKRYGVMADASAPAPAATPPPAPSTPATSDALAQPSAPLRIVDWSVPSLPEETQAPEKLNPGLYGDRGLIGSQRDATVQMVSDRAFLPAPTLEDRKPLPPLPSVQKSRTPAPPAEGGNATRYQLPQSRQYQADARAQAMSGITGDTTDAELIQKQRDAFSRAQQRDIGDLRQAPAKGGRMVMPDGRVVEFTNSAPELGTAMPQRTPQQEYQQRMADAQSAMRQGRYVDQAQRQQADDWVTQAVQRKHEADLAKIPSDAIAKELIRSRTSLGVQGMKGEQASILQGQKADLAMSLQDKKTYLELTKTGLQTASKESIAAGNNLTDIQVESLRNARAESMRLHLEEMAQAKVIAESDLASLRSGIAEMSQQLIAAGVDPKQYEDIFEIMGSKHSTAESERWQKSILVEAMKLNPTSPKLATGQAFLNVYKAWVASQSVGR